MGEEEGAFDEFAVLGEEVDGFGLGHFGEFVFEFELAVLHSGGVEEFAQVVGLVFEHLFELGFGRWVFGDVDGFVGDVVGVEKFEGFSASAAFGVLINFEGHCGLLERILFIW